MEKRIVVLNEEIYELSVKRYEQLFRINKPTPKIIKVYDEDKYREKHEKLCNQIRKYGKLILEADRILRDD